VEVALPAGNIAESFTAILRGEVRAPFGTMAMSAASIVKLGLQAAVIPILARLLGPQAFGLVALAMPLIFLSAALGDGGLGQALVRQRDPSRELESTVFWIALATSLLMAAALSLVAAPIARLMSEPKIVPILIALTLILPMSGSLSVPNARISREKKFSMFAVVDTVASVTASLVAIVAAILGCGPWSLVIQQLLLWGIKVCWLIPSSGFMPLFICRPSLAWPHLRFGLNAVGARLTDFGAKNFSTLLIGSLIGVAAAGHYAMGYQIVRIPELIISGPLYLSMFVSVAGWGDNRAGALPLAIKGLRGVIALLAPLFCGLALLAELLVKVVLGPTWLATGPILALLAPAGFFLCTFNFIGGILMGLGRSDAQFRLIVLSSALLILGTILGSRYGAQGVASGMSAGAILAAPAYLCVLARQFRIPLWTLLCELTAPILATAAMAAAVAILDRQLPPARAGVDLAVLVFCGGATFLIAFAAISGPRLLEDLKWLLRPSDRAVTTGLPNGDLGSVEKDAPIAG
jgi:O-antigen/teichoic acid export membrane protein